MTDRVQETDQTDEAVDAAPDTDEASEAEAARDPDGPFDEAADDSGAAEAVPDTGAVTDDAVPPASATAEGLQAQFDELNDRHLRLAAEFNNYRRRSEQERREAWSRAQADLVARFLDVLDDLHRVAELDLSNATVEAIMEGIDLVERKFSRVLEDSGVKVMDPLGEPFDPETMEGMMRVPTESEDEDERVAQVFAKGYTLNGILVRPARVSVHKVG